MNNEKDSLKNIGQEALQELARKNCVDSIDAIEFFDAGGGEYGTIQIDQLYNMPSFIASKSNIEMMVQDKISPLNSEQVSNIANMSNYNQVIILRDQLIASIAQNLKRFLESNRLLVSLNITKYMMIVPDYIRIYDDKNYTNPYIISTIDFIETILFDSLRKPVYSSFNDTTKEIDITMLCCDNCVTQLYIYYTNLIACILNKEIDSILINYLKIGEVSDYIQLYYKEEYNSMKQMFDTLNKDDAIKLMIKQIFALDYCNWCEKVLKNIIDTTIIQSFKTNFFIYNDELIDRANRYRGESNLLPNQEKIPPIHEEK